MEFTTNCVFPDQVAVAIFADRGETLEKFLIALAIANCERRWVQMVDMQFSPEDVRENFIVDGRLVMLEQHGVSPLVVTADRTCFSFVFNLRVMAFGASISGLMHRAHEIFDGFPNTAVQNLPPVQMARA